MKRGAGPTRVTELRRGAGPRRSAPPRVALRITSLQPRPVPRARRRPRDPLRAAARAFTVDRDEGICRRCGSAATDFHHRRLLGAGGSMSDPTRHRPDKVLMLCSPCHRHVHAHRRQAAREGFIVPRPTEPAGVVVRSWDGPLLLAPSGLVVRGEAAA